jgi:hypothetical protein
MNRNKVIYWSVTRLLSSFIFFSAWYSGTHKVEFTQTLGFPNYFRIELTAAKIVGAVLLLIPAVSARIREWIYVSFGIVLVSAAIAKYYSGYPIAGVMEPVSVFVIMVGANFYLNRLGDHVPPGGRRTATTEVDRRTAVHFSEPTSTRSTSTPHLR